MRYLILLLMFQSAHAEFIPTYSAKTHKLTVPRIIYIDEDGTEDVFYDVETTIQIPEETKATKAYCRFSPVNEACLDISNEK